MAQADPSQLFERFRRGKKQREERFMKENEWKAAKGSALCWVLSVAMHFVHMRLGRVHPI